MKLALSSVCMALSFGLLACSSPTRVYDARGSELGPPATLVELAATVRSAGGGRVVVVTLTGSSTAGPIQSASIGSDALFFQERTRIASATVTDDLGESMSGAFELLTGDGSVGEVVDAAGDPRSDWIVEDDRTMSPWFAHAQLPEPGTYAVFMYPDGTVSGRWTEVWATPVTDSHADGSGTQTGSAVPTSSLRVSP